ncbi:hypothetical protein ALC62_10610 [Cyphomyrmex costatus]|uniref:Uncharacterized protein n=1 Tax=Cyphomyrmex costatus TaxID=456900 RepID=A0A195CCW8_9HYME|nr:hypothetical protein ALC62_10610 [Cyphomyrmex costatus]
MSRKRDVVSRAVARISQRSNDVARPENIDHTSSVAQRERKHASMCGSRTDAGRCKSARSDEKRLIYGRISKPVKKGCSQVENGSPKNDSDDDNEDIAILVRDWDSHVLSAPRGRSWRLS